MEKCALKEFAMKKFQMKVRVVLVQVREVIVQVMEVLQEQVEIMWSCAKLAHLFCVSFADDTNTRGFSPTARRSQ